MFHTSTNPIMGFFENLKSHRHPAGGHVVAPTSTTHELDKENYAHTHHGIGQYETDSDTLSLEARNEKEVELNPDHVTANAQMGQQKAEAAALVWPKWAVYCTYGWIWICFFMLALEQGSTTQLNAAAYVGFLAAPELTTANILASIIGGGSALPSALNHV